MQLTHHLKCKYSGLHVGHIQFETVAGAVPYLLEWSTVVPLHPVFSMSFNKLLEFTKNEWIRNAKKIDTEEITSDEADILGVCYLALLHKMDCIKQDTIALPPIHVVQTTIGRLFALAYWKYHLESKRFRFPVLHISRFNANANFTDIGHYLDACFEVKNDYETKTNELVEQEKIKAAEIALKKLAGEWITPTSKKILWRWIRAHLPDKYQADAEGWLGTLFLGSNATVLEFDLEDIQLAEEMVVSSCPAGTGVMHAVRARLAHLEKTWKDHHASFELDLASLDENVGLLVNGEQVAIPHPGDEPKRSAFAGLAAFLKAHAKWKISMAAWEKHGNKEKDHGTSGSVFENL